MIYKSLEQQIQELWESRGMGAIEIRVESIGKNKFKWTITAEGVGKKKKEDFYFVIEMDLKDKTIKSSFDDKGLVVHKEIKMLPLSTLIRLIDKRIDKKLKVKK